MIYDLQTYQSELENRSGNWLVYILMAANLASTTLNEMRGGLDMVDYRKKIRNCGNIIACLAVILTFGCASVAQKQDLATFNDLYCAGQYNEAANLQLKEKGETKSDHSKLLQTLQAAAALRYAEQYQQSSALFDECEEIIKHHNEQLIAAGVASNIGATLVNDTVLDYRGTEYDGIMVNTYKALNFWQIGNKELARVEFNRALDRQRRAKERFAAEIAKQKEELQKKQNEENKKAQAKDKNAPKLDFGKNINNSEIDKILKAKYSNLNEFKSYPEFINPFTTYVAGLFFISEGDYSKAAGLLKEAYGMLKSNPVVSDDFASAEKMLDGQSDRKNYTWVIFENGLGPDKEEFRVDLPILLFTDKVKYTGIALPMLRLREKAYAHLVLKNSGNKIGQTTFLSSMDRVVQTEFKKRYPTIVTRAIVSAMMKTYGQYLAQKEYGDLGGFAAALYQAATTSADIRMWSALPKEFQLAKVKTPKEGVLYIETPAGDTISVEVPKSSNSLVYVKIPTYGVNAVYDVIKM